MKTPSSLYQYTLMYLLGVFLTFFSLQARAQILLAESTHMMMATDSSSQISNQERLQSQILLELLEAKGYSLLPTPALELVKNRKIQILLKKNAALDGYAYEDSRGGLTIEIHQDLLNHPLASQLLAHEFFHAIHFVANPNETAWVREGLAHSFERWFTGKFIGNTWLAAMKNPFTPLMDGYEEKVFRPEQSGHAAQYFYYLEKYCGGRNLLWDIALGPKTDIEQIENSLRKAARKSPCTGFLESARAFEVARVFNSFVDELPLQDGSSSQPYFLFSTSFKSPTLVQLPSRSVLEALPVYTPLILKPSTSISDLPKSKNGQEWRIFWFRQRFPKAVSGEKPTEKDIQNWQILIFKECRQPTSQNC